MKKPPFPARPEQSAAHRKFTIAESVEEYLTQPCLNTGYTAEYLASLTRPQVDEVRIDATVGSKARAQRRIVVNFHRDLWNAHLATAVEALRHEYRRASGRLAVLRLQVAIAWIKFRLTREHSWFVKWPTGSVALWALLILITVVMLGASGYGVFKLAATIPSLADSLGARMVLATIAGAAVMGIEAGVASIESRPAKKWYRIVMSCLTAGLLATYFVLLALFTGGLGADVVPMDRIGDPTATIGMPWLSPHVQWVQLFLEAAASLSAASFAALFVERHDTPTREKRPIKKFRSSQLHAATYALSDELTLIGHLRGARIALLSERKHFVNSAVISFERKLLLARRQEEGIRRHRDDSNPPAVASAQPGFLRRLFRN